VNPKKNVIQFGPSGGHDLPKSLPQLQARERAAHTGTVSERAFGKSGKILAATQTDFSPDGFRSSSLTTPASQSGLPRPHM
jgi:hypothetical protein